MVAPAVLAALALAAAADSVPPSPRIVRQLEPIEVRAHRFDLRSSETVRELRNEVLRTFPIDQLADVIALEPGVVAQGGEVHVRGGRSGDLSVLLDGISLNEPQHGRAMSLPLLAIESADLVNGGFDAEYGGALAGVLDLRTVDPGERWNGAARYQSSGAVHWRYDQVGARIGGPVLPGLGIVASADATLDDTNLPTLRTRSRDHIAGGSFGWRADNRFAGYTKITTQGLRPRTALHVFANRSVERPYDPMWSFDGFIGFCMDSTENCTTPISIRDTPWPGYSAYRAADHHVMTDSRSLAGILTMNSKVRDYNVDVAAGWMRSRSITSLDGQDNAAYVDRDRKPYWGSTGSAVTDPFYVYGGDEPMFRSAGSDVVTLRSDVGRVFPKGSRIRSGAGLTYHDVSLRDLDLVDVQYLLFDSLRTYRAFAPGGFAYAQGRWQFQGLSLNAGLRSQYFTSGRQAGREKNSGVWTLSPRLGFSYPMSTRDAFSLAYVRVEQDPARDYLYDGGRDVTLNRRPFGNFRLVPATVISYEASVRHIVDRDRWLTLSLFYRDLFGQVGTRDGDKRPHITQLRYANEDEGHASGFEVSAFQKRSRNSLVRLSYTYLEAWGTMSREEGTPYGPRINDRALPIGEHPLDWDRKHSFTLAVAQGLRHGVSFTWTTIAGSPLPWTPRPLREYEADQSRLNSRRLSWSELSSASVRWLPPYQSAITLGFDVRNVFDGRSEVATTVNGYPHPFINTLYDDYSAYRSETGQPGGAYWDDANRDGALEWVPVHDPRLIQTPRSMRLSVNVGF